MPRWRRHTRAGRRAPACPAAGRASLGQPRWRARWRASFIAQSWAPLPNESTALSRAAPGPKRAQSRTTAQRARTLGVPAGSDHVGVPAGSDHIGNLNSTSPVLLGVLPALRIHADHERRVLSPILGHAPGISRDLVGPLPSPMQPTRTHARERTQAGPRRTLSFTIASHTIASSPDGSVTSSAASSACGTPAAAVGGGCRFRASSTVTSSSSPCNHAFGHSAARALEPAGERGKALCHSSLRVVPWRYGRRVSEHPWSTL
jgi:hypothetical protein